MASIKSSKPIKASDAMGDITMEIEVQISGLRWARYRMQMATYIIRFAAWVGGYGIEVKEVEDEPEPSL